MPDRVGQQIGNYRLVRLLGSGGFAEVYLGQHVRLASKQAAIKLLHLIDVDAQKFQQEAETTEQLVHPHIVRLLDFDLHQGAPFLVMDYAPGGSLRSRHPKGSQVSLTTVVGYLKEIAPALQYAHDQHILHRDIKPDNMLIGRQGELLLSDFGMAVLSQTGRTSLQSPYSIGGTPSYMAPEQYRGKPEKASDQYALAVVVYEWLCGTVPFSEGNFIQVGYQHTHEPVPPLREKNPAISPEVEVVIMKALAKDPKDRFERVQTFAATFEQVCIPTLPAEEPGPGQGILDKEMPPDQSSRQRGDAGQPPQRSVVQTPVEAPLSPKHDTPLAPTPPDVSLSPEASAPLGELVASRYLTRRTMLLLGLAGTGVAVTGIGGWWVFSHRSLSNSGTSSSLTTQEPTSKPTPIPMGTTLYTYHGHAGAVNSVAWSRDGKRIASGSDDKTVQVWDATNGTLHLTYKRHAGVITTLAWSPNGKYIASGSGAGNGTIQIWDPMTGNRKVEFGNPNGVNSVAWSPDGKYIASGVSATGVEVWDLANGLLASNVTMAFANAVAWSPDGKYIASGNSINDVNIVGPFTGDSKTDYTGHSDAVLSVAWSPDGKYIASAGKDKTVQVWDPMTGNRKVDFKVHSSQVNSVAWSPDSKKIASGSTDRTVQVWDPMTGKQIFTNIKHTGSVASVAWSPDGKYIASGSGDRTVQVWQAP